MDTEKERLGKQNARFLALLHKEHARGTVKVAPKPSSVVLPASTTLTSAPHRVVHVVSAVFDLSVNELLGPHRMRALVHARWAGAIALHKQGKGTLFIAKVLARERSTIQHMITKGAALVAKDEGYAQKVDRVRRLLNESGS